MIIIDFWNSLALGQQIFVCVAIPATILLIIQIVMMLIGMGGSDTDVDGDGVEDVLEAPGDETDATDSPDGDLSFFTVRGIVSMLCIMGWSGLIFLDPSLAIPLPLGILISFVLGAIALVLVAFAMRGISRLQSSGNLDLRNAIGKVGQVYLTIPGGGKASGKVNLTLQEQYKEFTAITTSAEDIKTGSYVRVVALSESGVLVVEPLNK